MKKILAIMLALMLCLTAFVACGNNGDDKGTDKEQKKEEPAENNQGDDGENSGKDDQYVDSSADDNSVDEENYIVSGDYVFDENGVVIADNSNKDAAEAENDGIIGSWEAEIDGETGAFTFTEDGIMFMTVEGESMLIGDYMVDGDAILISMYGEEFETFFEAFELDGDTLVLTAEGETHAFTRIETIEADFDTDYGFDYDYDFDDEYYAEDDDYYFDEDEPSVLYSEEDIYGSWEAEIEGETGSFTFKDNGELTITVAGEAENGYYKVEDNYVCISEDGEEYFELMEIYSVEEDTIYFSVLGEIVAFARV